MGLFKDLREGREIEVKGIKFNVKALNGEDIYLFADMAPDENNPKKQLKASMEIVYKTLNNANPEFDRDDLKLLSIEELTEIMKVITELNKGN